MHSPSLSRQQESVIALAAIAQACELVIDISENGKIDSFSSEQLVDSLFCFNPSNTLDIYAGDLQNLKRGLTVLSQLSKPGNNKRFQQLTRYMISLVALEKQLSKQAPMLDVIRSRLEHVEFNKRHFIGGNLSANLSDNEHIDYAPLYSNLSGIYQDTISTLKFRIQVTGNMQILTQNNYADHIRALLFSGIRAAMLWRQLGGSRWQLIFKRSQIEKQAKYLLSL